MFQHLNQLYLCPSCINSKQHFCFTRKCKGLYGIDSYTLNAMKIKLLYSRPSNPESDLEMDNGGLVRSLTGMDGFKYTLFGILSCGRRYSKIVELVNGVIDPITLHLAYGKEFSDFVVSRIERTSSVFPINHTNIVPFGRHDPELTTILSLLYRKLDGNIKPTQTLKLRLVIGEDMRIIMPPEISAENQILLEQNAVAKLTVPNQRRGRSFIVV